MRVYERFLWPLFLRMDPERAHALVLRAATLAQGVPGALRVVRTLTDFEDPRLRVRWRGLTFPNPVGLAAGLDKDAVAPRFFSALGFGFVEVGTVTPKGQPGNPKPRVHRLPSRKAMVNSMGFPGEGAAAMAERLRRGGRPSVPLGINLGKNAATPLEEAAQDYVACLTTLYPHGDYFVVNVSSPNTLGLTNLQARPALEALLRAVAARRGELAGKSPMGHEERGEKPLLVKLSPDLTPAETDAALEAALGAGVDGVIATNTSVAQELKGDAAGLRGGISGAPLRGRSAAMVRHVRRHGPPGLLVIGVGGIFTAEDAHALMEAGADLVQVYTGLVFRGPGLVRELKRGLAAGTAVDEVQLLRAPDGPFRS